MDAKDYAIDELESVLLELIEGSLADAEFDLLVQSLRASADLRQRASRFLVDEVVLNDEINASQQAIGLARELGVGQPSADASGDGQASFAAKILRFPLLAVINRNGLLAVAAAITVIVGLLVHNYLMMQKVSRLYDLAVKGSELGQVEIVAEAPATGERSENSRSTAGAERPPEEQQILARVIGADGLSSEDETSEFRLGSSIEAGRRVKFPAGAIELLLVNGAKVTAEGPVEFELATLSKMNLQVGRVVAAVPRTARGYTIVTPTSELVDIGTQFGVLVDETGDTELHVFDGDVVARSLVPATEAELLHAGENEALRFGRDSSEADRFAASDAGFVRRLGVAPPHDLPQLPYTKNLSLWFAADAMPGLAQGDLVSVWSDILVGDNKYANEARQFDPARKPAYSVDSAGRPVVQFNGTSTSLLVDPVDYDGAYTIFVACNPGPTSFAENHFGGFLFKHGSVPSLELSALNDRSVRGWIWAGSEKGNVSALTSADRLSPGTPAVIGYSYDSNSSRTRLWLNGELQGESTAAIPLQQTALAVIGSHDNQGLSAHYLGGIYEIVVYEEALDEASLEVVDRYLASRYPDSRAE